MLAGEKGEGRDSCWWESIGRLQKGVGFHESLVESSSGLDLFWSIFDVDNLASDSISSFRTSYSSICCLVAASGGQLMPIVGEKIRHNSSVECGWASLWPVQSLALLGGMLVNGEVITNYFNLLGYHISSKLYQWVLWFMIMFFFSNKIKLIDAGPSLWIAFVRFGVLHCWNAMLRHLVCGWPCLEPVAHTSEAWAAGGTASIWPDYIRAIRATWKDTSTTIWHHDGCNKMQPITFQGARQIKVDRMFALRRWTWSTRSW